MSDDGKQAFSAARTVGVAAILAVAFLSQAVAQEKLSVAPPSGATPLAVTFRAYDLKARNLYAIDFGDGSPSQSLTLNPLPCAYGIDCSSLSQSANASHTYSAAGTYTATLIHNGLPLCVGCQPPILGSVTITVTL
jgi:hypothetical protein